MLPDIALYYRAMPLGCILNWCHDSPYKAWVWIAESLVGRNLAGAPWIPSKARGLSKWISPLTLNTLVWDRMHKTGK